MGVVFTNLVAALGTAFTALLLLSIMFSGLVMMFKPERGRDLLKSTAIAAGLFLLGMTIARACFDALR